MELTERTTVLFPKAMVRGLRRVAKARHLSVGRLIREACSKQYGLSLADDAPAAADELAQLALPVADVTAMKREVAPLPAELMP